MKDKLIDVFDGEFGNYVEEDMVFVKMPSIELALKLFVISKQLDIEIDNHLFFERSLLTKSDIFKVILECMNMKTNDL